MDLLFTNDELLISDIRYEDPIGKSDYLVLVFNFHGGDISDGSQDSVSAKPFWHKADFKLLDNFYNSVDWGSELEGLNVEAYWSKFKNIYEKGVSRHVPFKDCSNGKKKDKQPWFHRKVKDAVRLKSVLFKVYRRSGQYVDKLAYIKQRNITDDLIKKAKGDYESDIMRSIKSHPKRFYSMLEINRK